MWPECSCFRKCLIRIMAKFPRVEERLIFPPSVVVAFLVFILFCLIISRASLNGDNGSVCPLRGNAVQNITPVSLKRATERHPVDWLLLFEERDELEIMYKRVPGKRLALIWCSIYFFAYAGMCCVWLLEKGCLSQSTISGSLFKSLVRHLDEP